MNLSDVVLETPLIMEKSAFTSTAILFLRRDNSREECSLTVRTTEDCFQPNYDRIKLKRLSYPNLFLCVICRCDIKYNSQKRILKCEHAFHIKCIKQWILMQNVCPICMTTP
ncbi:uncharacterized protein LOC131212340 [Anopheles bellator]|uniref:uncharacterized protein LOC131212340 n=1 Tax=Anopheles bellator TaxID=139047 RepID=UPI00264873D1|nr:uncharacterized protein LOC131212340 [Anopheles bellator]